MLQLNTTQILVRGEPLLGEGDCSVMWGNAMIIFGGEKSNTTTQMYDFSAKTWKVLALAHFFFGCVLMPTRDKVLVVSTIPGGDERRSDIYDIAKKCVESHR